jgi:hypothetical protein
VFLLLGDEGPLFIQLGLLGRGGKGHEFIVAVTGVRASPQGIAGNGVLINTGQPSCLAGTAAILEVLEDGEGLLVGQPRIEQGSAFAFGEAALTGTAGEHAALLAGAVAEADAQVALAPQAIIGTVGVLTTEQIKFFHEHHRSKFSGWVDNASLAL